MSACIDGMTKSDPTAIHLASAQGCQEVLLLLLRAGADVSMFDRHGYTALHHARIRGCGSIIENLLEYGADVDSTPWEFFAPLYLATEAGRVKSAKTLLDRGANLKTRSKYPDDLEWTPLHTAADTENHGAVKLLLDRGANIEAIADNLYRSLYLAVSKDRHRTMELLLSYGANNEAKYKDDKMTALYLAVTEGCASTVKCYSKVDTTTANSNNGWSTLHLAVRCGYASTAKLLLEYNAPLEPLDRAGAMPIHTAVWEAQYYMRRLLLDFGAAVDVDNFDGH